jgi:hypothetical protein
MEDDALGAAATASSAGLSGKARKRPFTAEEDVRRTELVEQHGDHVWRDIEQLMPGRSSRQCRERWTLYLSPTIRNDPWTADEDVQLLRLYQMIGPKWTQLAKSFPKRTALNVKNRQKQLLRRAQRLARFNRLLPEEIRDPVRAARAPKPAIIVPMSQEGPVVDRSGEPRRG